MEAVACERGRVVAVGASHETRRLAASPADIVDLGGHTVVPGFVDAHLHLHWLGLALERLRLGDAPSLAACVERVAERAWKTPPGGWISGFGWNRNAWPEGRWPTRRDLDAVTGDRPTLLGSTDGHLLWVNGAALRAAGIDQDTPDPPGGAIVRDADGEPTGVLKENATALVYAVEPPATDEERDGALTRAMEHAVGLGLTSVGAFEGPEVTAALSRLRDRGALRVRVTRHIAYAALDDALASGARGGDGDEWLRWGHLKLFADGTLGSQTASMLEPFAGSADNRGIPTLSSDDLRVAAGRAAAGGIATAIHAIGDRANRAALDALVSAPRVPAMPHRVEHAQLLHPDDLPRFAAAGIIASMQPTHATSDRDTAERYWGARCATAYAWRPLQESGATLAFGSDAPVETCDPLAGLYAAVARHNRGDGRAPWRPELALSLPDALRAYTVGAAAATGEEGRKGILAPGYLADMAVLSDDICAGLDALERARVVCTIVGGKIVAGAL